MRSITQEKIESSLDKHSLPNTYADDVASFILPIAKHFYQGQKGKPLIVGIQGSQGSGKSTSAAFLKLLLEHEFQLRVEICSIDDFYLSRLDRQTLAKDIHPLLQTRGVPGTHHTDLIAEQFALFRSKKLLTLPIFDKATDDPLPKSDWLSTSSPADILIFEGWCVGLTPQEKQKLNADVNELEKNEDPNRHWRAFVNDKLSHEYKKLFTQLDALIVLQAPNFDCVYEWRQLQEKKLISNLQAQGKSTQKTMNPDEIKHFIQHYQRLTLHGLNSLKKDADFLLQLNAEHRITSLTGKHLKGFE